jgi:hypothetical protein
LTAASAEIIVVFKTTHETLTAEKGLKGARIRTRTMVKPRSISSECALALSFSEEDREQVRGLCEEKGWLPVGYYSLSEDGSWTALEED